ncbi:hypothetical protein IV203_000968 [Nitzschia inconspicua]|uniref:Fe2OG dioxygenase domain-containing protein n=1 Tax=Nitzschia inconspicua TaxID=303405 RepID=A0A9K3L6A8_9STRA|nr:hypothetical protein IV203_000968 [Nitzschia inconspicua]
MLYLTILFLLFTGASLLSDVQVVVVNVNAFAFSSHSSNQPSIRISRNQRRDNEISGLQTTTTTTTATLLEYVDDLLQRECTDNWIIPTETEILERVQKQHASDCQTAISSPLALDSIRSQEYGDDNNCKKVGTIPHEWIVSRKGGGKIAVQSLTPVLNGTEIAILQNAVDTILQQRRVEEGVSTNSRFTYQFKGNSEVHAADFAKLSDGRAITVINKLLLERLYPLVREAFPNDVTLSHNMFVYDSLMIRYNASASDHKSAGQPLHRDLGVISVNVMLNDGFEGGGTYFDNQADVELVSNNDQACLEPIKPSGGPGHCIAHFSNERHAGAGTTSGVRDILVFFLSLNELTPQLSNAHLKQTRSACDDRLQQDNENVSSKEKILCRIRHQRLAIEMLPNDGEAYLYLGSALLDFAKQASDGLERVDILNHAIQSLQHASTLTPNDARIYNNWGIALARLEDEEKEEEWGENEERKGEGGLTKPSVQQTYQRGLKLLLQAREAGCAVDDDLDALSLNYGLYLSNQDAFADACAILEHPVSRWRKGKHNSKVVEDAYCLQRWCETRIGTL